MENTTKIYFAGKALNFNNRSYNQNTPRRAGANLLPLFYKHQLPTKLDVPGIRFSPKQSHTCS